MLLTLSGAALSHCRGQPVFPQKRQHSSSSPGSGSGSGSGPVLFCCPPRLVLSVDTFPTFLSQSSPPLCAHLSPSDCLSTLLAKALLLSLHFSLEIIAAHGVHSVFLYTALLWSSTGMWIQPAHISVQFIESNSNASLQAICVYLQLQHYLVDTTLSCVLPH